MREKHGWVKLTSDTVLLGLDSYQFHLYHLARALCVPLNAQQNPGVFDLQDSAIATLMRCSRATVIRVKNELKAMNLLTQKNGRLYVAEVPMETLHNHDMAMKEIANFLLQEKGMAARLNSTPRRTGQRHPPYNKLSRPATPPPQQTVSPSNTPVSPSNTPVSPSNTPVSPSNTPRYKNDHRSIEDKKYRREEEGGQALPPCIVQTPASKYLFDKTGRKRWANQVQKESFEQAEAEVGEVRMVEAINWALESGISNIKSMVTAARRGQKGGYGKAGGHYGEGRGRGRIATAEEHEREARALGLEGWGPDTAPE